MPDPRRGAFDGFEHVRDVRAEIPRLVPRRTAVSSEVERDHVEPAREPLLGQLSEAVPVSGDSVQADDWRGVRIAPLVGVEAH